MLYKLFYEIEQIDKEHKDLKKLYKIFLTNISLLIKKSAFQKNVEIFEIISFMLKHGYLSQDKFFKKENIMDDNLYILGAKVITGGGVCRHTSSLLADIYHENNLESHLLCGYFENDASSLTQKLIGNHALCYQDTRFFDLQNHTIFYLYEKNRLISSRNDIIIMKKMMTILFNSFRSNISYNSLKRAISNILDIDQVTIYNDLFTIEKVNQFCIENIDIFEKFYKENKLLYKEITACLKQSKKM